MTTLNCTDGLSCKILPGSIIEIYDNRIFDDEKDEDVTALNYHILRLKITEEIYVQDIGQETVTGEILKEGQYKDWYPNEYSKKLQYRIRKVAELIDEESQKVPELEKLQRELEKYLELMKEID